MFSVPNVEAYLKQIVLDTEGDKRLARLRFFITPITYELAKDASPAVASMLFRKNGNGWVPVQEMGRTEILVPFPSQSLSYRRHPEYVGHNVLIPTVSIGETWAQKVIPGNPNFSLIFRVSFEIDDPDIIKDLVSLLHEKFYLTFAPMQPALFPKAEAYEDLTCRLCDAPLPEFAVENSRPPLGYCAKHVHQKEKDETVRRIRDAAKAAAAIDEMQQESQAGDPLLSDATFINQRNAGKSKRKAAR